VAIGLDYSAFSAHKLVAAGGLEEVLRAGKPLFDRGRSLLFFRDDTGEQVDFDFRGTIEDVLAHAERRSKMPAAIEPIELFI